jgi:predicted nucleic acid-binding protein
VILYADTSLLVKHYLTEAGSAQVDAVLTPPTVVGTAVITRAEVSVGLAKATRLGMLTVAEARQSLVEFRSQWPHLLRLRINEAVAKRADELAWDHQLRGYDAVHLAVALTWQVSLDEPLTLGTYDRQLWEAGQQTNLAVWPAVLPA